MTLDGTCPLSSAFNDEHMGYLVDATKTSLAMPFCQCVVVCNHASLPLLWYKRVWALVKKTPHPNRGDEPLSSSVHVLLAHFVRDGIDQNPRNGSHAFAIAQPRLRNALVTNFDEYHPDYEKKRTTFMDDARLLCFGSEKVSC